METRMIKECEPKEETKVKFRVMTTLRKMEGDYKTEHIDIHINVCNLFLSRKAFNLLFKILQ
jgi:hypothetical protein